MSQNSVFNIASRHAERVSMRRAVVASNIANANTPGYKSREVEPFALEPLQPAPGITVSHPSHFGLAESSPHLLSSTFDEDGQEFHSGNNVSLDRELIKAGSVAREQNLNTGLLKAFNRLIALSTRG